MVCTLKMACLVRVPTEVVKQRMQAGIVRFALSGIANIYKADGIRGFYRGYGTTVLREIPFSFVQFPIYEALKVRQPTTVITDVLLR